MKRIIMDVLTNDLVKYLRLTAMEIEKGNNYGPGWDIGNPDQFAFAELCKTECEFVGNGDECIVKIKREVL